MSLFLMALGGKEAFRKPSILYAFSTPFEIHSKSTLYAFDIPSIITSIVGIGGDWWGLVGTGGE